MAIRTEVVPLAEIFPLRHRVLRPGLPLETAEFPEDDHPATCHVAAYEGDDPTVLGCITLCPDALPGGSAPAYRFRGMATDPAVRGRGYGAAVLRAASFEAAASGGVLLWCNGRTEARGFYEHHGFTVKGPEFVVEGVGPHYIFTRHIA